MKQVTIENVKARIAQLETSEQIGGRLPIRHEFEMACLRQLVELQERVAELEENDREQMAELYRRNATIHRLQQQPAPVAVPDAIEPTVEAIKRILPTSNPDEYAACIGADMWNACCAAMLQGSDTSPATDNTAQQFEALATSGKSEHLLNAERIAREAQALSDRMNATSEVNHRVSGWSERQQKVIAYSLWRFSCTAYQKANQAAQTNNKDMFDRFIRDARCAEEIREEFTSAGSGKP